MRKAHHLMTYHYRFAFGGSIASLTSKFAHWNLLISSTCVIDRQKGKARWENLIRFFTYNVNRWRRSNTEPANRILFCHGIFDYEHTHSQLQRCYFFAVFFLWREGSRVEVKTNNTCGSIKMAEIKSEMEWNVELEWSLWVATWYAWDFKRFWMF